MKSIENFNRKLKQANASRSKELRMTIEEAIELCADLNLLMKKQLENISSPTVSDKITLSGGKF